MDHIERILSRMADNKREYHETTRRILADPTLSATGKRARLADAHQVALAKHSPLRSEYDAAIADTRTGMQHSAFGPPIPITADGTTQTAIRTQHAAAVDRASKVEDAAELTRMLDRANLAGDAVTASAVALIAFERRHEAVLNHWRETDRTGKAAQYDELQDFERTYGAAASYQRKMELGSLRGEPTAPPRTEPTPNAI